MSIKTEFASNAVMKVLAYATIVVGIVEVPISIGDQNDTAFAIWMAVIVLAFILIGILDILEVLRKSDDQTPP